VEDAMFHAVQQADSRADWTMLKTLFAVVL